jgi:poly(3-hydroxybutyrate) depolymerase
MNTIRKRSVSGAKSFLLAAACVLFSLSWANAQSLTPKTVAINSNCNGYYEYLPVNYSAAGKTFPLMIYCGGAGSFGNGSSQISRILAEGPPYYIANNQMPASFTVNGETSSYLIIAPQFVAWPAPQDVEDVLNYVLTHGYKVDMSRIYLTGFSAGGDATWKYPNTGLTRAKKLAALVPVAGYNYPYVDSGAKYIAQAKLPVWALHSNDDQTAPVTWSQNFVNKVNSFNPPILAKITRFNGVAHDPTKLYVYNPTFRDGGFSIYEWMLQYRINYPPVADAGADQSFILPANSASLNGGNSHDPENTALSFSWSKVGGPIKYTIGTPTAAATTVSNLVAGAYNFELKVTDGDGYSAVDTVKITVTNPNQNQLPAANAGNDISINLPQTSVGLNGSGSTDGDGDIETYSWSKVSGPSTFTFNNASLANPTVSNLKKGTYVFRLIVTDNEGGTAQDLVQVTVVNPFPNVAPVSKAGNDQSITLPVNSVTLDGSASFDSDGDIVTYLWSQIAGPAAATLGTAGTATTTAGPLQAGLYRFELKVTDDSTASGKDTIDVVVLPPPSVNSKYVRVNLYGGTNPYNLDGWNNWNVPSTSNISSGNFNFSDGSASSINSVLSSSAAIADNGATYGGTMCPAQVLRYASYSTSTRTLTLRGLNNTLKYDIEFYCSRASTGNSTQFTIGGVNKSVVSDNNKADKVVYIDQVPTSGQLVITLNRIGTYNYLNGFTIIEKSLSQAVNVPPVAHAGNDALINLPVDSVQLNGSTSADSDGSISFYAWSKISGPASSAIVSPASAITEVKALTAGVYKFELAVTDNFGAVGKDTVVVTVNNPGPQAPVANAGVDRLIQLPADSVHLDGSGSFDTDGNVASYEWSQLSGPTSFAIDDNTAANPVITSLTAGSYQFELKVTDNDGLTATDDVTIVVNTPPVADAGADVSITIPVSSTSLSGAGSSDVDGTISSYAWSKIAGPSQFNISSASAISPTISSLVKGTYTFKLLVTIKPLPCQQIL